MPQCDEEHIYTSILLVCWRTYFNKRYLSSISIASKQIAVLGHFVIAELTVRVKSVGEKNKTKQIKGRQGLGSLRLSHPGFNQFFLLLCPIPNSASCC